MSAIALIHTHYSIDIDTKEVLARFQNLYPRQLLLPDLFGRPILEN